MDRLKTLFERDGIEYNEKVFTSDVGIADLGPNPFVSHHLVPSHSPDGIVLITYMYRMRNPGSFCCTCTQYMQYHYYVRY